MSDALPTRTPDATYSVGDTYWINWTAASDDGAVLLGAAYHAGKRQDYGTYAVHRDGTLRWVDPYPQDGYCGVFWVDVAGDGSIAASGGWQSKEEIPHEQAVALTPDPREQGGATLDTAAQEAVEYHGFVRILDAQSADGPDAHPDVLFTDVTGARVNSVAVSQNGTWIVAGSGDAGHRDNATRLYHCSGNAVTHVDRADEGAANVQSVALSDDGTWIVIGNGHGVVRLFENENGHLVDRGAWDTGARYVQFVDGTPDGSYFVAAGSDGHVFCFERDAFVKDPDCLWTFAADELKNVYGATISDDASFVAAATNANGGTVYGIDNAPNGNGTRVPDLKWRFHPKETPNPSVTLDGEARYLTVADGYPADAPGDFYLLDAATGDCLWTYRTPNMCWPMTISRDASAIVGGSDDGTLYVFDGATT